MSRLFWHVYERCVAKTVATGSDYQRLQVQPNIAKDIVEQVNQRGFKEFDKASVERALLSEGETLSNETTRTG